jgi:hypothetical protein
MPKIELFPDSFLNPETETESPAAVPAPRFNPANMALKAKERLKAIENEVKKELRPKSYIQRRHAEDWAFGQWEKEQYRGFSNSIVRQALQPALENILKPLLRATDPQESLSRNADRLAKGWLSNEKVQVEIEEILAESNLDERCVEAEAWRLRSADVVLLQRMSTSAMNLQDRALANFTNYQDRLEMQPEEAATQNIEAEDGPVNKLQLS